MVVTTAFEINGHWLKFGFVYLNGTSPFHMHKYEVCSMLKMS